MKKLAFVGGVLVAGAGLTALLVENRTSQAADHLDTVALSTNPMMDIDDVYAWTTSDASKVNLAMTVSPGADASRHFGPTAQYVFHVKSAMGVGLPGTETKVICTFASDTSAQCWVGTAGYVTGDPSNTAGVVSADGKVRLFAGRRSDPFFFNLQGFRDVAKAVTMAGVYPAPDGKPVCPALPAGTAMGLAAKLSAQSITSAPPCSNSAKDCFLSLNGMAIVLQVDKGLLNTGTNTVLGVWGSTHIAAP